MGVSEIFPVAVVALGLAAVLVGVGLLNAYATPIMFPRAGRIPLRASHIIVLVLGPASSVLFLYWATEHPASVAARLVVWVGSPLVAALVVFASVVLVVHVVQLLQRRGSGPSLGA